MPHASHKYWDQVGRDSSQFPALLRGPGANGSPRGAASELEAKNNLREDYNDRSANKAATKLPFSISNLGDRVFFTRGATAKRLVSSWE